MNFECDIVPLMRPFNLLDPFYSKFAVITQAGPFCAFCAVILFGCSSQRQESERVREEVGESQQDSVSERATDPEISLPESTKLIAKLGAQSTPIVDGRLSAQLPEGKSWAPAEPQPGKLLRKHSHRFDSDAGRIEIQAYELGVSVDEGENFVELIQREAHDRDIRNETADSMDYPWKAIKADGNKANLRLALALPEEPFRRPLVDSGDEVFLTVLRLFVENTDKTLHVLDFNCGEKGRDRSDEIKALAVSIGKNITPGKVSLELSGGQRTLDIVDGYELDLNLSAGQTVSVEATHLGLSFRVQKLRKLGDTFHPARFVFGTSDCFVETPFKRVKVKKTGTLGRLANWQTEKIGHSKHSEIELGETSMCMYLRTIGTTEEDLAEFQSIAENAKLRVTCGGAADCPNQ